MNLGHRKKHIFLDTLSEFECSFRKETQEAAFDKEYPRHINAL
jgi:hypothetical protein